jgi:uncharacterized protein (DUF2225 family)
MIPKKIYNSTIICPVCDQKFPVTKVRIGSYRIASQDSDLAINYEGINPTLYDIFVCTHCGYAASQDSFANISPKGKKIIAATIASQWQPKDYSGERTLNSALDAYKLALYCLQLCKAKSSEIAKTCLRIAWIYRWKSDPREMEFLKYALDCYIEAYQTENFPIKKMDGPHCTYLIAELHRKVGNIDEAAQWFGRLIHNPEARQNQALLDRARDQYQLIKDLRQENE